jgi:hypothetical protein
VFGTFFYESVGTLFEGISMMIRCATHFIDREEASPFFLNRKNGEYRNAGIAIRLARERGRVMR